jgi:hypothetical protein
MTPKEKADELFITYRYALSIPNAPLGEHKDQMAKVFALIVVNEIIEELSGMWCHYGNIESQIEERQSYWLEVKQEIEKL